MSWSGSQELCCPLQQQQQPMGPSGHHFPFSTEFFFFWGADVKIEVSRTGSSMDSKVVPECTVRLLVMLQWIVITPFLPYIDITPMNEPKIS